MEGIPDRVLSLIEASGQSRRAFAQDIGLDDSKLSKSLSGTRRFSSLDLARIADKCGVTVDWLVTGEEPALAVAARTTSGQARTALEAAKRYSTMREDLAVARLGAAVAAAGSSRPRAGPTPSRAARWRRGAGTSGRGRPVSDRRTCPPWSRAGLRGRRGRRRARRGLRRARGIVGRGEADRAGHIRRSRRGSGSRSRTSWVTSWPATTRACTSTRTSTTGRRRRTPARCGPTASRPRS